KVTFVVASGTYDLDGLELVAVFEHRVSDRPTLNVGGPGDQGIALPESNRLSVPLRNLLNMLSSNQYPAQKVIGNAAEKLHFIGSRHHFNRLLHGELRVIP